MLSESTNDDPLSSTRVDDGEEEELEEEEEEGCLSYHYSSLNQKLRRRQLRAKHQQNDGRLSTLVSKRARQFGNVQAAA